MKKTNEKKINWKNVAIIGGVFVLGAAAGVVGGEKILTRISLDDFTKFGFYLFKTSDHTALVRCTITSPKTGRKLNALLTEKDALKMSEQIGSALKELGVEVD